MIRSSRIAAFLMLLFSGSALAGLSVIHNPINDHQSAPATAPQATPASGSDATSAPQSVDLDAAEREADELIRKRREIEKKYETINRVNPVSSDFHPTQATGLQHPAQAPLPVQPNQGGVPPGFAALQGILGNRIVQNYIKAFSNPEFLSSVTTILNSHDRTRFLVFDGILLVAMMIFRAWRSSKQTHVFGRVWVQIYCFGLTTVLCGGVLPILIFGDPYRRVLRGLFSVFFS